jgi:hypothetical protein
LYQYVVSYTVALYQLVSPILARIGCFHVRFGALPAFSDYRSVAGGEEAVFVCPRLRERFRKIFTVAILDSAFEISA